MPCILIKQTVTPAFSRDINHVREVLGNCSVSVRRGRFGIPCTYMTYTTCENFVSISATDEFRCAWYSWNTKYHKYLTIHILQVFVLTKIVLELTWHILTLKNTLYMYIRIDAYIRFNFSLIEVGSRLRYVWHSVLYFKEHGIPLALRLDSSRLLAEDWITCYRDSWHFYDNMVEYISSLDAEMSYELSSTIPWSL